MHAWNIVRHQIGPSASMQEGVKPVPYTGAQKLCRTVGTSASQRSQRGRPNYRRLLLQCPLKREMHGVAFWLVRKRNAKCLLALPQVYEANVSRRRARSVAEVWQRDDSEDATVESSSRTGAFEGLSSAPCQILETSPTEEQSRAEQSRTWNVVTVGAASCCKLLAPFLHYSAQCTAASATEDDRKARHARRSENLGVLATRRDLLQGR